MGNNDRSDKIEDDTPVKVTENLKNVQDIDNLSYCQSYNEVGKNNFCDSVKEIKQNRIETGKYYYKENTENITIRSKETSSDSICLDQSGCKPVQGKRQSRKETSIKYDINSTQNHGKEKIEYPERRTVQRHSQKQIFKRSEHEPAVSSKPVGSNKSEIVYHNTCYVSKNRNVSQKHTKHIENTVEKTPDVSMAKLNIRENKRWDKRDNPPKKLNTKALTKHTFQKNEENIQFNVQKGAINKTSHYTQTRKQAEDASANFITDIKVQNMHSHTRKDEMKTILQSADLTLENEIVSNHCKTLKDEITNQTYSFNYLEVTPLNINLGIEIAGTIETVKEQLTIVDEANLTSEEKINGTEIDAVNWHDAYRTRLQDEAIENNQHSSQYYWYGNRYYLPCQPVTLYPLHPYGQSSPFGPHFSENPAIFNHQLYHGQIFDRNHTNELSNNVCYDQNVYQSTSIEQNLDSMTNECQNFSSPTYYSENLNFGDCKPFVMPWYENGMMYFQYYPDFSPV